MKSAGSRVAGTLRKEGGVQVKVTLRKPTLAAKSATSAGNSECRGSMDYTMYCINIDRLRPCTAIQSLDRTSAPCCQLTVDEHFLGDPELLWNILITVLGSAGHCTGVAPTVTHLAEGQCAAQSLNLH